VEKWSVRGSNPCPYINYAMSLPTELSSRGLNFGNLPLTNTIAFHESHLLYAIKFFILNSNEIKLQNFAHCMPV